jgi:ABC-type dipeptide/oligopeptide/nickel transport system permease subunit
MATLEGAPQAVTITDLAASSASSVRRRWRVIIPAAVLGLLLLVAIIGPFFAPYPATQQFFNDGRLLPPGSPHHLLGTDALARDVLSRLIVGTRMSMLISVAAVAVGSVVGFLLGISSGYLRGPADTVIMRVMDGVLAFPTLILALIIAVGLGPGVRSAIIAIGVVSVPGFARLARAQTLRIGSSEYIASAHVMGAKTIRVLRMHIIPNIWVPCAAQAALALGYAIPAEATLSFLGLGVQPPTPSWGNMIGDAYATLANDPWLMTWPVLAIMITTLSASLLADGLAAASSGD